jgi:hypothetical protein
VGVNYRLGNDDQLPIVVPGSEMITDWEMITNYRLLLEITMDKTNLTQRIGNHLHPENR